MHLYFQLLISQTLHFSDMLFELFSLSTSDVREKHVALNPSVWTVSLHDALIKMNRRGSSRILQQYEQNQPPPVIWGVNQELNPGLNFQNLELFQTSSTIFF